MAELLTSIDVVNQSFKKSMRGYDAAEVDEFLDHVAETLQIYAQKTKDLERELAAKSESLSEYGKIKDALQDTLVMAQQVADEKMHAAEADAKKIIDEAMDKADEICRDANKETERLRDDVSKIRDLRIQYEQEFRGILGKFSTLLNQTLTHSPLDVTVDSVVFGAEKDEKKESEAAPEKQTEEVTEEVPPAEEWLNESTPKFADSGYTEDGEPEENSPI